LTSLTFRVNELEARVGKLSAEVQTQQLLQLLDSLIGRTDGALDFAFTTLEDILQHALIGQASSVLLPASKLEEIQVEINKISTAIVDTAYERMKATIVSDPFAVASLTCFVNLYAMSRETQELMRLIAIPWFQGIQAFAPALDYGMVLLNQEDGTFTVIDPSEEADCLEDKCISSNPTVSTTSLSCGIPQYFNRHLSACVNEDVMSNGMFLKRLLYDGIIYSVRTEVDLQIFCDSSRFNKGQKLSGAGLMNLPPGCTLTLTDKSGAVVKMQSSPPSHLYEAQAIELIAQGPREIFKPGSGPASNTTTLVRLLNQQMAALDQKLTMTTEEVEHQNFYVVLLGSLLGVVTIICIVTSLLLYRYSRRFRRKVRRVTDDLLTGLSEAKRTFVTFEQMAAQRAREEDTLVPLITPRPPTPVVGLRPPAIRVLPSAVRSRSPPVRDVPARRAGLSTAKPDSLNSILNHLTDLEFELLELDDTGIRPPTSTEGYTLPDPSLDGLDKSEGEYFTSPPIPPKPSFMKAMAVPYSAALDRVIVTEPKKETRPTLGAIEKRPK
jgi:hypothetical protein